VRREFTGGMGLPMIIPDVLESGRRDEFP